MTSYLRLQQAREGNALATADVVEALRPRLVSMALYYARCSQEDPDDLLQEAWIGLLEAIQEVDLQIGTPEQYLIQRARWRLLDAIKYARIRRCTSLELTSIEEIDGDEGSQLAIEMMVAEDYVQEFASELKAVQRSVLFCLLKGLTWREAGHALGCTSANIAYHVRQIRQQYERWSAEKWSNEPLSCSTGCVL